MKTFTVFTGAQWFNRRDAATNLQISCGKELAQRSSEFGIEHDEDD
jgi:hypothetical protein